MLHLILIFATMMFAQPATAPGTPTLDRENTLKAIDRFLANPAPGPDIQTIIQFAQESDECEVAVDQAIAPWLNHQPPYPQESIFLVAFIAGNVKAQLTSHHKGDDPYAGMQTVIATYEKLSQTDKDLKIPEIERIIDIDKKGELKTYVDKIVADRKK